MLNAHVRIHWVVFLFMKKIKSTMAAVAQIAMPHNMSTNKRNSEDNGQKKKGIFKGIKKVLMPGKKEHRQEVAEIQKEVTAEDIKELIENNHLLEASKNLMDLEHKVLKDPLLEDKMEELETLYKKLQEAVFTVITDSLTEDKGDLLSQAVNVIVEQEKEDEKCDSNKDSTKCSRPRQWKRKWEDCVKSSVNNRIIVMSQFSPDSSSGSSVSQNFLTMGKTLKKDMVNVVTHVREHYPKDFDVCNAYLQCYHQSLLDQITSFTEFVLGGEDAHYILFWVLNFYPNMILKDPILAEHIDESQLCELISPSSVRRLKECYIIHEIDSLRTYMNRSLDVEMERWKSRKEPEILGDCHHSELHIDIIQIYNGGIKRAGEINQNVEDKVAILLPNVMVDFLTRYKDVLKDFLEKNKTHPFHREISITNLNCCSHFRKFIEIKHTNLYTQMGMLNTIRQCEDFIYADLFQELFQELKTLLKKSSQNNPLCSYQAMQDIIKTTESYVSGMKTLCPPCHKDMIARIHLHLVMEYLTRLLKKKVRDKNPLQLQTWSKQISENGILINEFCEAYKSEEEWLKPVIPKVAEIIRLQDLSAIQLEVATLVEEYPDIRNKQIEAILYMKGNLSSKDIRSILKVSDTIQRQTSSKPQLFELLKTS